MATSSRSCDSPNTIPKLQVVVQRTPNRGFMQLVFGRSAPSEATGVPGRGVRFYLGLSSLDQNEGL